ncbi:D-alanyl-D-alanine carboxypeptidase/D-alanyl-D-alanine endopeptidase [Solitalea koreensis]|uniref:D-alanyl-D-alanine carboxypeptidase / D-alanyl-D-alanine-endopeptidase (Penicillin-binding protein 4) n=1 Tax=Solitalea koreensis TaxID=543615 RepID=A0A521DCP4_9SPHI|nr:D-alanyl-D-alanine carboxypeptidase/D-alanyl-D-alanine-endopeptidase [Solitalea koreensis]SMO69517.1 D-alanyl-D-alanine carboxypeptidase / D-alanyl-D-alanine-endopeptidase (penicillin-binding protein 4) [Solitalea koreensis]
MYKTLSVLFLFLSTTVNAQLQGKLSAAVSFIQNDEQLKYGTFSLTVLNASTGKEVFSYNPNLGLAPASTLKILTSSTALALLGENYTYKTELQYNGNLINGVLKGALIVKGGGDPTLGSWRYENTREEIVLNSWIEAIRKLGIKEIDGDLLADDRLFGTQSIPDGWIWQDIGNYYGAGNSALTWRENQFNIYLKPGVTVGDSVTIQRTEPLVDYIELINELKTGEKGSGDNAYVYLPPYSRVAYLRGTVGLDEKNFSISGAIPDPGYACVFRMRAALKNAGILVKGNVSTARLYSVQKHPFPQNNYTFFTTTSPKLDKIVFWLNKKSVNLYGEHLLKTLALNNGREATTDNGIKVLKDFWKAKGIDDNAITVFDGSGLSPADRISSSVMANVLLFARKQSWFNSFYASLPDLNGMKMKDGYINNVRSYAGYVTAKSGTTYVFSFIVTNFNGSPTTVRQKMWKVLDELK